MRVVPLGRLVQRITDRPVDASFKIGLEAIESGTGQMVDSPHSDYQGDGTAFRQGDVLFGKLRPYLAKAWMADRGGSAVGEFFVFRPVAGRLASRYLRYALLAKSFLDPVSAAVFGAKMPRASWDTVRDVPIHLPELSGQAVIADFLDRETAKIDALVIKQEQLIQMLRERRNALLDWLILQDGPPFVPLRYVAKGVTVGIVVQPAQWYAESGGTLALRGLNVRAERIDLTDTVQLSEEGDRVHRKSRLATGDVVIVRTGQSGIAAAIPADLAGSNAIDLLIVKPGKHLDGEYLAMMLNAPATRERAATEVVGTIQGHLNVAALRALAVPVPTFERQLDIVLEWRRRAAAIDDLIAKAGQFIALAKERRAALITAAVTGQTDVSGSA